MVFAPKYLFCPAAQQEAAEGKPTVISEHVARASVKYKFNCLSECVFEENV